MYIYASEEESRGNPRGRRRLPREIQRFSQSIQSPVTFYQKLVFVSNPARQWQNLKEDVVKKATIMKNSQTGMEIERKGKTINGKLTNLFVFTYLCLGL